MKKFQAGEKIIEWKDHVNVKANPTLASDAADALMSIYTKRQKGIFHCCGRECITRVELARKVAKIFGFDEELISTSFRKKIDLTEWVGENLRLPKKTCLDTTETEGLTQFKKEMEENKGNVKIFMKNMKSKYENQQGKRDGIS